MQEKEIRNAWAKYSQRIDSLTAINHTLAIEVTQLKVKSILGRIKPIKKTAIILGIPWVILLYFLVGIGYLSGGILFTTSFMAIAIINSLAVAITIYHLVLLDQIDNCDSILSTQQKIAKLKDSEILGTRIAFLQLPFWQIFHLSPQLMSHTNTAYFVINLLLIIAFVYLAVWLYKNIHIKNIDKKWMKFLFSGIQWDPIVKASQILQQIEQYKKDEDPH